MKSIHFTIAGLASFLAVTSHAAEFESMKSALENALGKPTKVFKKKYAVGGTEYDLYYSKDDKGNPTKFASVQTAVFKPDCTHTWVIGMSAKPEITVDEIRVVEMKCVKATEPARKESFLSQFKGKKVADIKSLDKSIDPVATATYTGIYTTDAVKRSLELASQFKP